jgi:hypothetical protein
MKQVAQNNLHQVAQNQKIGKPNHLQFWSNKTKGLKQGSQNRLRSPMRLTNVKTQNQNPFCSTSRQILLANKT